MGSSQQQKVGAKLVYFLAKIGLFYLTAYN